MKYNTILFDLDGTLLYTLEDLTDSLNHTLALYHKETHPIENVRRFVGNGLKKLVERALPLGLDDPLFDDIFKDFVAYYNTHNQIKTRPYDGVIETTEKLSEIGIQMAIVTNKGQTASNMLLKDYFYPHIKTIIGDNGIHKRKPDPEPIYLAMEALDISDKSSVLYVGDSDVDATTAINSGLDYVLCTYGFRDKSELEQFNPICYIDHFNQILELFK